MELLGTRVILGHLLAAVIVAGCEKRAPVAPVSAPLFEIPRNTPRPPAAKAPPVDPYETINRDLQSMAGYYIEQPIKEALKAPSTAKFSHRNVIKVERGYALASVDVDAQNAFGAMMRETYCAVVREEDRERFSWKKGQAAIPCNDLKDDTDSLVFLALNDWPGAANLLADKSSRNTKRRKKSAR